MTNPQFEPIRCPHCGHEQTSVRETIESWQWERPVYGCASCMATFIGPWRTTDGAVTPEIVAPANETIAHAL